MSSEDEGRGSQMIKALQGLRELILAGALRPGMRVSEPAMVERLGVSRTPVRLALDRLEREGLVAVGPTGGFIVRSFTAADLFDAITIRGTLEGLAARLAAERRPSTADLAPLQDCVAALDAVLEPPALNGQGFSDYVRLNALFHERLAGLCGSATVIAAIEQASNQPFAGPSAFVHLHADVPEGRTTLLIAQDQHRNLLEAVALGQSSRAEALAREHCRIAQRKLAAALADRALARELPGGNWLRLVAV